MAVPTPQTPNYLPKLQRVVQMWVPAKDQYLNIRANLIIKYAHLTVYTTACESRIRITFLKAQGYVSNKRNAGSGCDQERICHDT